jgi:hypothetical protein
VGVLFYSRSNGQYILASATIMTVFGTSHSIKISKYTDMIVSLTKIYFISDLKERKTSTVMAVLVVDYYIV